VFQRVVVAVVNAANYAANHLLLLMKSKRGKQHATILNSCGMLVVVKSTY
jgi:hypothetical protein